jgi:hypothetical protein
MFKIKGDKITGAQKYSDSMRVKTGKAKHTISYASKAIHCNQISVSYITRDKL